MSIVSINAEISQAWEADTLPKLADLLADAGPDVIAVQECPGKEALQALADRLGMGCYLAPSPRTGIHTGLLWARDITAISCGDAYAERTRATWHGFASCVLHGPEWPSPITFIAAHLIPHDIDAAVGEARFIQSRLAGTTGVLLGDLNHGPLAGPEPDWARIPAHNRASRTIIAPARPDEVLLDRRVGLVLTRAGLVDVAAHVAQRTGDAELLAHTGVNGLMRVDQAWVTADLADAVVSYARLDHRNLTDHHPIRVNLDLSAAQTELTPMEARVTPTTKTYHWILSYHDKNGPGDVEGIAHPEPGTTRQELYHQIRANLVRQHFGGDADAFRVTGFSIGPNEL